MRYLPKDKASRGGLQPTVGVLERIVIRAPCDVGLRPQGLLHPHVFGAGHALLLTTRARPSETRPISSKLATEFKVAIYRKIAATLIACAWLAPGLPT